ncbi:MAG: GIY-YIG nuclease family protein [Gemmatimonas sp.]
MRKGRVHVRPPQSTLAHRRTLRELVRAGCQNKPGVYRMFAENGTVVYVGQSRVLRTRLLSYFRAKGARNKAARILRHAFRIEWEYTPTEFGALLRELRLIKLHRPHFNRMMVSDDWPRGYIALTGEPVPGLRVVAQSDYPNAVAMYGPFRKVFELREAAQTLATLAGLRDCTIDDHQRGVSARKLWFADDTQSAIVVATSRNTTIASNAQGATAAAGKGRTTRVVRSRAAGCLRYELGTCSAPCIGQADRTLYARSVRVVREFLEGRSNAPLDVAQQSMVDASNKLEFERAGSLRDHIARLTWLQQRLQQFHANVDRLTFRYHALAPDGQEYVYLVRRGTVRAERVMPTQSGEHLEWDAIAQRVYAEADATGADIPLHDLDEFHLVSSWFRRRPAEKARTFAP